MFKMVRFRGFRSLTDTGVLKLSKLNILLGPNNSGKSSILYCLLMLKQTLLDKDRNQTLVTSGPDLDLGSFLDLVSKRRRPATVRTEFMFDTESGPLFPKQIAESLWPASFRSVCGCDVSFAYDRRRNVVVVGSERLVDSKGKPVVVLRRFRRGLLLDVRAKEVPQGLSRYLAPSPMHFLPTLVPAPKKQGNGRWSPRVLKLATSTQLLAFTLAQQFNRLRYVAPVRERIPPYGFLGTMPSSELSPTGQNLMKVLAARPQLLRELERWLGERFKLVRDLRLKSVDAAGNIRALYGKVGRGEVSVNLASMGCGVSQLVPVIMQTVLTPRNGCLLVEQPDIHLHPGAQADLADLFVERAAKGRGQFIIETHSEHFLMRVRRRVAEKRIDPSAVRIFFVTNPSGRTIVKTASVKPNGHVVEWPKGFFSEGYREAMAIAEAGLP